MTRLLSFLILLALIVFVSNVEIQCSYSDTNWGSVMGLLYTCAGFIVTVENPSRVTGVSGSHTGDRDHVNVTAFRVDDHRTLSAIPKGIDNFFPNLVLFQWFNGNLSTIDSSVFEPFPNLLRITLNSNKIVSLDSYLFQHTRKLKQINITDNSLLHIGRDLLNGLSDLSYADFRSNPCISLAANNAQEIEELNQQFPIRCPPPSLSTTNPQLTTTSTQACY